MHRYLPMKLNLGPPFRRETRSTSKAESSAALTPDGDQERLPTSPTTSRDTCRVSSKVSCSSDSLDSVPPPPNEINHNHEDDERDSEKDDEEEEEERPESDSEQLNNNTGSSSQGEGSGSGAAHQGEGSRLKLWASSSGSQEDDLGNLHDKQDPGGDGVLPLRDSGDELEDMDEVLVDEFPHHDRPDLQDIEEEGDEDEGEDEDEFPCLRSKTLLSASDKHWVSTCLINLSLLELIEKAVR